MSEKINISRSAAALYSAIMAEAKIGDRESLAMVVRNHRVTMTVLDGLDDVPLVQEAKRKTEDAFAACLRAYGDRILDEPAGDEGISDEFLAEQFGEAVNAARKEKKGETESP